MTQLRSNVHHTLHAGLAWLTYSPQHVIVAVTVAITASVIFSPPIARLLAVPIFIGLAITDIRTRRIKNRVWPPLYAFGVTIFCIEMASFWPVIDTYAPWIALQVGVGAGIFVPLFYALWRTRRLGGADLKAIVAITLIFPIVSPMTVAGIQLPLFPQSVISPTMSVTVNSISGGIYLFWLAGQNLLHGRIGLQMFFTRAVAIPDLLTAHGRVSTSSGLPTDGADVDTVRMYLRWRGLTLSGLQAHPDAARDPKTIVATGTPHDGRVESLLADDEYGTTDLSQAIHAAETPVADAQPHPTNTPSDTDSPSETDTETPAASTGDTDSSPSNTETPDATAIDADDQWGAEAFCNTESHPLYGTTVSELRDTLEMLATPNRSTVPVAPGLPFLLLISSGLLITLIIGNPFNILLFT